MRVLAVGAHPDDLDILCAGTLAKYVARGDQVVMAISTNGEAGSNGTTMEETSRIREKESRASAALIGAELIWLDYHDEFLYENEKVRLRYIDLVRQARPDVIITHDPQTDYHPDHLTTGQLLWNTRVMAAASIIKTEHPAWPKIPDLYFMDTIGGINFQPQDYVDITETMDLKRKMLSHHVSQIEFMRKRYNMTLVEFMEICSAFRGLQASVRYAECFRRSMTFPANYQRVLP
ncbi:MAG: PIG-L deacetylase family protein [Candidatus Acidiferrales bacterium]